MLRLAVPADARVAVVWTAVNVAVTAELVAVADGVEDGHGARIVPAGAALHRPPRRAVRPAPGVGAVREPARSG